MNSPHLLKDELMPSPGIREAIASVTAPQRGPGILNWSSTEVEYLIQTNAANTAGAHAPWREPVGALRDLVEDRSSRKSVLFLDTTTIWTAFRLIGGDSSILQWSTFLDLDKVTRAIVLNDHVFHMPSPYIDTDLINSQLGDEVLIPLHPVGSDPEVDAVLWNIWFFAAPEVANERESEWHESTPLEKCCAADAWHLFNDLASAHALSFSKPNWNRVEADGARPFSSDPVALVRNLVTHGSDPLGKDTLALIDKLGPDRVNELMTNDSKWESSFVRYAGELVQRATFNQLLADSLGITYDASSARVPAIGHLARNSTRAALAFADIELMTQLVGERVTSASNAALFAASGHVHIPPLTAYALHRSESLARWWDVVAELRRDAARYRKRRNDLQEALFVEDVKTISSLRGEVLKASTTLADAKIDAALSLVANTIEGTAALVPATPAAFAGPIAQAVRLLLTAPTQRAWAALRRRVRPDLRLFHDVSETAASCTRMENRIRLLWGIDALPPSILELNMHAERLSRVQGPVAGYFADR